MTSGGAVSKLGLQAHEECDHFVAFQSDDPTETVELTTHMGIGAGHLTAIHVGGVFGRYEYVMVGNPIEQIGIAEPLAASTETCISPEVRLRLFFLRQLQHNFRAIFYGLTRAVVCVCTLYTTSRTPCDVSSARALDAAWCSCNPMLTNSFAGCRLTG